MDVLVVDDESIARMSIAQTLSTADYRVTTASDGQAAWELLQQAPHQLVVSDWEMPRMGGVELCRRIRNANSRRYVYFILLTSHVNLQDTLQGFEAGADDYITKPFHPGELLMRVNTGRRIIGLETRGVTVFALAKLAESRDSDTGTHLERVRSYCRILTEQLRNHPGLQAEIDDEFVELISETSPLHDIGKVAIPDAILRKPGKLTDAEFQVMKAHTRHGAETLEAALAEFPNARFLEMARNIALSHHERYDGGGYPNGLAGEQIPLCGRIVALADVYDALTSARPYKDAWTHELAREHIIEQRGCHFDPHVVDAFLAAELQFVQVRERLSCEMAPRKRPNADAVAAVMPTFNPVGRVSEGPARFDDCRAEPADASSRPLRALVVDDEMIARKMLVFALAHQGFQCDSAEDGHRAGELLIDDEYDVAVLDLRMPHKNGHALAVEMLQRRNRPAIIILTAVDHPRMTEDLLSRGVDDIVYKPANYHTLAVRAKILAETRRRRTPTIASHSRPAEAAGGIVEQNCDAGPPNHKHLARTACHVYRLSADGEATTEEIVAAVEKQPQLAAGMLHMGKRGRDSETARRFGSLQDLLLHHGRRRFAELALLASVRCTANEAGEW